MDSKKDTSGPECIKLPPFFVSGFTVFDLLAGGGGMSFGFWASLKAGPEPDGSYGFLRLFSAGHTTVIICAVLAFAALFAGLALFFMRLAHYRRMARLYPRPPKKKQEGVLEALGDAFQQMLGLKPYEGMPDSDPNAPRPKRSFKLWLRHDKTRSSLSAAIIVLTIYFMPKAGILMMGPHVLLLYLVQFAAFVGTLIMALIAWIELGE